MAEKEQKRKAKGDRKAEEAEAAKSQIIIIALVIIAVLVISIVVGYLLRSNLSKNTETFEQFQQTYLTSRRVALVVSNYNVTAYPAAQTCADAVIYSLVSNREYHRNASTIDFYVVNYTGCTFEKGLGNNTTKPVTLSPSACLNDSMREPSILINYSATNVTRVQGNHLYTSGDLLFLSNCGIASEIG